MTSAWYVHYSQSAGTFGDPTTVSLPAETNSIITNAFNFAIVSSSTTCTSVSDDVTGSYTKVALVKTNGTGTGEISVWRSLGRATYPIVYNVTARQPSGFAAMSILLLKGGVSDPIVGGGVVVSTSQAYGLVPYPGASTTISGSILVGAQDQSMWVFAGYSTPTSSIAGGNKGTTGDIIDWTAEAIYSVNDFVGFAPPIYSALVQWIWLGDPNVTGLRNAGKTIANNGVDLAPIEWAVLGLSLTNPGVITPTVALSASVTPRGSLRSYRWYRGAFKEISKGLFRAVYRGFRQIITQDRNQV